MSYSIHKKAQEKQKCSVNFRKTYYDMSDGIEGWYMTIKTARQMHCSTEKLEILSRKLMDIKLEINEELNRNYIWD